MAVENLSRQGYEVRLPLVRRVVRRKISLEPLFPRYLFLRSANPQQSFSPIRSTIGVSGLVRFGMELGVLPHATCEAIMAFSDQQQQGGLDAVLSVQGMHVGDKVLVATGPFSGLEGLVSMVAKDRVIVLLNLLGKDQSLSFSATDLTSP